uniref:Small ribosomal subunit protein uS8c n=1 Tax=Marattia cicutifolia TaxID=2764332 RepID=A0A7G7YHI3_9MONI|nr:ribosomal protein S8 [Marattia cicutifolia]QNH93953.1 ribosomal protein S8 [Marattia cicutifolia]
MVNDTVANMITSIRNANIVKATTVCIPATNITKDIGKIFLKEGFITNLREHKENTRSCLILTLKYRGRRKKPCVTNLRRISKPGLRIYSNHREIPKVLGGMGIVILSTSSGIVTDREARQKQIGGEILCYVW